MPPESRGPAKKPAPVPQTAAVKRYIAVLRSDFYYDHYYYILFFTFILLCIISAITLCGLYERTLKPMPDYFATTADGKLSAPLPLSQPGLTTPALLEWAVESIITSYTFTFIDYEKVIADASSYYTKTGYQNYRRALIESNIVGMVQRSKYVLSAVPTYAPIILKENITTDGAYTWLVQYPISLTFQNVKELAKKDMIVTMLIKRVPITDSPTGIAIEFLIVREGKLV